MTEQLDRHVSCAPGGKPYARSSEADAFYKILQTIARFPITDPKNMDAINMRLIAEGALAVTHPQPSKGEE